MRIPETIKIRGRNEKDVESSKNGEKDRRNQ